MASKKDDDKPAASEAPKPISAPSVLQNLTLGFAKGLFFGLALEKAKVYLPKPIMDQMVMRDFTMLKTFLTAAGTGTVTLAILRELGPAAHIKPTAPKRLGLNLFGGWGATILGGLLLGSGMTLTGACPGTVLAQLGAGVPSAPWTFLGGLTGVLTFGYWSTALKNRHPDRALIDQEEKRTTLHRMFKLHPFGIAALLAGTFALVNYAAETYRPWQQDTTRILAEHGTSSSGELSFVPKSVRDVAWAPYVGGAMIGLLQLPSVVFSGKLLGSSSAYATLSGLFARKVDPKQHQRASYFTSYLQPGSFWQLGLVSGAVVGALISARLSGFTAANAPLTVSPLQAFLGGFIMLTGARIGDGCTSGHGISGIARLGAASLLAVAAMFAGGMATAQGMKAAGML